MSLLSEQIKAEALELENTALKEVEPTLFLLAVNYIPGRLSQRDVLRGRPNRQHSARKCWKQSDSAIVTITTEETDRQQKNSSQYFPSILSWSVAAVVAIPELKMSLTCFSIGRMFCLVVGCSIWTRTGTFALWIRHVNIPPQTSLHGSGHPLPLVPSFLKFGDDLSWGARPVISAVASMLIMLGNPHNSFAESTAIIPSISSELVSSDGKQLPVQTREPQRTVFDTFMLQTRVSRTAEFIYGEEDIERAQNRVLNLAETFDALEQALEQEDYQRIPSCIDQISEQEDAFTLLLDELHPSQELYDVTLKALMTFEAQRIFVFVDDLRDQVQTILQQDPNHQTVSNKVRVLSTTSNSPVSTAPAFKSSIDGWVHQLLRLSPKRPDKHVANTVVDDRVEEIQTTYSTENLRLRRTYTNLLLSYDRFLKAGDLYPVYDPIPSYEVLYRTTPLTALPFDRSRAVRMGDQVVLTQGPDMGKTGVVVFLEDNTETANSPFKPSEVDRPRGAKTKKISVSDEQRDKDVRRDRNSVMDSVKDIKAVVKMDKNGLSYHEIKMIPASMLARATT